ncbi:hypothetical protein LIER_08098 [Lithospermum erythrorhizon]|uniref:Uncharacterized protein n=1 Tax=Lithospermum erythrorhizon TaxID=34254 RepID=A0AAV3PAQ3_LITER
MMEIRVKMKKVVIFTVKGCYRTTCNHPFLVGMLSFLVYLYSSFPFLFSLLVSASPVLACTAILLGTLLSFGKPNIPEIEREERISHEIVSLRNGVYENNVVFDRNESVSVERYGDKGKNVVDELSKETSFAENEIGWVGSDSSFEHLLEKRSKEMEFDGGVPEERHREFIDLELESKSEMFGERLGDIRIVENHYSLIPEVDDEHIDLEDDRSPTGSVDSKVVNVDTLDSPPCTPWRHVNEEDEEENVDDEELDSGSDRAESSSPDASMADILPVLDELHPLLDGDAPHPVSLSHDDSDASSEQSARSDESSNESDDIEKQVSDIAENDHEDGEDEEEPHEEEEDQTKSAITWTEQDERNLMDLGSSELERNQRLENLIARRRARKTLSVVPETNLIDLESTDFTFNVPPILTSRNNPFDHSQDSYEDMGLPPIPGSAPSVLLHRRNPFDIPYDSSEEKPDLMEDSFQQEFTPFQSKEHFFRRHESFNTWRTPFGINRQEKQDTSRFKPYFVAERLGSEGTSYSHFQRQSSGLSDSKASSVPDTGSIGSSENTEEWNVSVDETSAIGDGNNDEDDITPELDHITRIEQASELAGHGSESSEEENSIELDQVEKKPMKDDETERKLQDTEYHQEAESRLVVEQRLANQFEMGLTETYSNVEAHEQSNRSISSSSSLSEESERIYVEKEVEDFPSFTDGIYHPEEPSTSVESSLQGSHLNITLPLRDEAFHRNPVYDLSPSAVNKTLSRSSNASDPQAASEVYLAPAVVRKSVSFAEIVTEIGSQEIESISIVEKEVLSGSSEMIQMDESQMASSSNVQVTKSGGDITDVTERISGDDMHLTEHADVDYEIPEDDEISASALTSGVPETEIVAGAYMEMSERVDAQYDFSESDKISASATLPVVPETVLDHIAEPSSGSLLEPMYEDVAPAHSTSFDTDTDIIQSLSVPFNEPNLAGSVEEMDSADTHGMQSVLMPTGEQNLVGSKEEVNSKHIERALPAPLNMPASDSQSISDHTTQGESMLSEEVPLQSNFNNFDLEGKPLTSPRHQYLSTESPGSPSVEEMALSQNPFYKPSPEDNKESQKSEISELEPVQKASTANSWSNYDPQIDNKLSLDFEVPTNPESTAIPTEVGFQSVEELDEIKEIDEQLLEELDTVGDFRVKQLRELHDPVEFGSRVYHAQHDSEPAITLFEGNHTQADQYDDDMKHVSKFEISANVVDLIDPSQYDGIKLGDSGLLQSTENTIDSNAKQTDIEIKSLEEISDIEDNDSTMAEIEAHFAKTIEAMIIKAELASPKGGVSHIDHPPSFVDSELEETSIAGPESIETAHGEANILMQTQKFQDLGLDLNQLSEENLEQVLVSGSVLNADGTKDTEGTFPELLISEGESFNDSNSALMQQSRSPFSEAFGFSEDGTGTAVDVRADLNSLGEAKSGIEESDVMETLQDSLEESNIIEAKIPESDAGLISERKSLDDSFSALKQASQSSPKEPLIISEDVGVDIYLPSEAISGAVVSEVTKAQQNSFEEPYSIEAKTHDVLISERKYLDESFSALNQKSQSSPTEALKMSEDVRGNMYSPSEVISGAEEFDVKETQKNSLEEPYSVEAKTPESHDVLISERQSQNDSGSALKKQSQSSPSEALKLSEDESAENVRDDIDFPGEEKSGVEESDLKETQQNSLEEGKFGEVKVAPEGHDVTVSDTGNSIKETGEKSSSSNSDSSSSDSGKE